MTDPASENVATPRTDELIARHTHETAALGQRPSSLAHAVRQTTEFIEHARTLERELTAALAEREEAERQFREEHAIVDRVWKALGISTYEQAKPYAIDEHVARQADRVRELEKVLWIAIGLNPSQEDYPDRDAPPISMDRI